MVKYLVVSKNIINFAVSNKIKVLTIKLNLIMEKVICNMLWLIAGIAIGCCIGKEMYEIEEVDVIKKINTFEHPVDTILGEEKLDTILIIKFLNYDK